MYIIYIYILCCQFFLNLSIYSNQLHEYMYAIHTYVCTYTYTHTQTYTHTCTYMHCVHNIHTHMHTHIHKHKHKHIYIYRNYADMHVCTYARTHTRRSSYKEPTVLIVAWVASLDRCRYSCQLVLYNHSRN